MLILSIPFLNKNYVQEKADEYPAYWKEYRLDYAEDLRTFPTEIIDDKTILTIRSKDESGIYQFDLAVKIGFYKKMISQKNCLCDLEINEINNSNISELPSASLILSYHDFSVEINYVKLEKIINTSNSIASAYLKIAVNVNRYSDLIKISELISQSNKPVIFAGMGKFGKISRVLYKHLGAESTFIGLSDNPTARGQLTPHEADNFKFNSITNKTKIGGIIGGEQIEHSLGLKYYNDLFKQKKLDAVYLPFVTDNFEDLWNWIHKADLDFYGFSITMPFKKIFGEKKQLPAINLFLPKTGEMLNTDLIAFKQVIDILQIKKPNSILIFGSGATAEIALSAFVAFENVTISSRNETSCKILAKNSNREFIRSGSLKNEMFNLIINCTPIGMNGEDFMNETGISNFKKVIDLPYHDNETKLIEYCRGNSIPFVDGKKFWQWQAEKQLDEFLKEINK